MSHGCQCWSWVVERCRTNSEQNLVNTHQHLTFTRGFLTRAFHPVWRCLHAVSITRRFRTRYCSLHAASITCAYSRPHKMRYLPFPLHAHSVFPFLAVFHKLYVRYCCFLYLCFVICLTCLCSTKSSYTVAVSVAVVQNVYGTRCVRCAANWLG